MRRSLSDFAFLVSVSSRTVIFFSLIKCSVVPLVVKYFMILCLNVVKGKILLHDIIREKLLHNIF